MNKSTILLLEDDPILMKANRGILTMNGYRVLACTTLCEAREAVEAERPDLMILDVRLSDGSGMDFCRKYRTKYGSGTPVLFLTVLKEKMDLIAGYDVGATDYLVKPFDMDVLLMKLKALLKYTNPEDELIAVGPLRLDYTAMRPYLYEKDLALEPKEFAILAILIKNRSRYITAGELYNMIWRQDVVSDTRTVKVRISAIRQKLGKEFDIVAIRGKGYRLIWKMENAT